MPFLIEWHLFGPGVVPCAHEEMNWEASSLHDLPGTLARRLWDIVQTNGLDWPYEDVGVELELRITRVAKYDKSVFDVFGEVDDDVEIWPDGRWTINPDHLLGDQS